MIDRNARRELAQQLRHLVCGTITNDEFEDRCWEIARDDRAVEAITDMAWFLYSDLREYRLRGAYAPPPQAKRAVAIWILFLRTDLEYTWAWPTPLEALHVPLALLTLGLWTRLRRLWVRLPMEPIPDSTTWPFETVEQLAGARAFRHGVEPRGLA